MFKSYSRGPNLRFTDRLSSCPTLGMQECECIMHTWVFFWGKRLLSPWDSPKDLWFLSFLSLLQKVKCNHSKKCWYLDWTVYQKKDCVSQSFMNLIAISNVWVYSFTYPLWDFFHKDIMYIWKFLRLEGKLVSKLVDCNALPCKQKWD